MTRALKRAEVIELGALLKDNIRQLPGEDRFEYINGMSDEKLAAAIHSEIKPEQVGTLRRELYGNLQRAKAENLAITVEKRSKDLADLAALVKRVIVEHNNLVNRINAKSPGQLGAGWPTLKIEVPS